MQSYLSVLTVSLGILWTSLAVGRGKTHGEQLKGTKKQKKRIFLSDGVKKQECSFPWLLTDGTFLLTQNSSWEAVVSRHKTNFSHS
jgi:hypothetical protein